MPPSKAAPPTDPGIDKPVTDTTAAPDAPEAAAVSTDPEQAPDTGGVFVNVGAVALTIPFPPAVVKPGRVVELPYTPTHRDLKPATDADIAAAAALDAAETKAASAAATTPGQER